MGVSVSVLASGSRGNCALVATSSTRVLVDAGLSGRETFKRLRAIADRDGERTKEISAILITHEHSDHVAGLQRLATKLNVPVFLTAPTHHAWSRAVRDAEGAIPELPKSEHFSAGRGFRVGDIEVMPFTIPHDAADPVGFLSCGRRQDRFCHRPGQDNDKREVSLAGLQRYGDRIESRYRTAALGSVSVVGEAANNEPGRASVE